MNHFRWLTSSSLSRYGVFRSNVKFYSKQMPRSFPIKPKSSLLGDGGYVMLIIPVTAFGLGTWQIQRRRQKLDMIQLLEEKTNIPPVPIPNTKEEVENLEYRKVSIRGTFDYSKEMVIYPRHDIHAVLGTPGNIQKTSNIGGYIVVPFILSGSGRVILVNRGFVLKNNFSRESRLAGQIEGEVELTGLVRKSERKNIFMPKSSSDPVKIGFWMYRDIEMMSKIAETEPIFIDADIDSSVPGGPIGGQTKIQLRNEHMSYILTWYALSIATFLMWRKRYYRKAIPDRAIDYINKMK